MSTFPDNEPTISSRPIYSGRIIDVRVDTVRLQNGRESTREIVDHAPSICVVPVDAEGNVLMVRQYRKPVDQFLLEVPAGGIEAGETPEEAAQRELQEEIGHTTDNLLAMSAFWLAPGWCSEFMYSFLATDLKRAALDSDEDEFIEVVRVPLSGAMDVIASGEVQDAKSVASLLLALQTLGAD
ncbi:MAG: NUDIX hydrolase [Chloroflexi bacterium]|nr:NUDIX hydrolase [Chloroflexota bacterium]